MLAESLARAPAGAVRHSRPGARELVDRALAITRRIQPVPQTTEARLLSIQAGVFLASKDWDQAIAVYKQAIDAASALFDLRRLALMYAGLTDAYPATAQNEAAA